MFYRVIATLAFTIEDEATDFYHDCEIALPKASTINPNQPNIERGTIRMQKCYHDETPTKPCEVLKSGQVED